METDKKSIFKKLALLFMCVTLCIGTLTSCNNDEPGATTPPQTLQEQILGAWADEDTGYIFKKNYVGYACNIDYETGIVEDRNPITYTITGNRVTYKSDDEDIEYFDIISITEQEMFAKDDCGSLRAFKRTTESNLEVGKHPI